MTANNHLYALNALNGKIIWRIKPVAAISRRGLVIDKTDNNKGYLYLPLGNKIYKINTDTGIIEKNLEVMDI